MTTKISFLFASAGGALAVILGAIAAHGVDVGADKGLTENLNIGVEYQMYHCLALLMVAIVTRKWGSSVTLRVASGAFIFGILLFSGGLYISALTSITWIEQLIPLGGVCFIAGWCALFYSCYKSID